MGTSASSSVVIPATDSGSSMRECPSYNVTSGLLRSPFYRNANSNLLCQSRYSSQPRRSQPPKTLSFPSKVFDSHVEQVFTKMASVESIGACSLDLEASTSTGAGLEKDSANASEYTLQSDTTGSYLNGSEEEQESSLPVENGHVTPAEKKSSSQENVALPSVRAKKPVRECTVAEIKLPSYVSISCAINGYTNYSKFCRSRENSPARTSFRKTSLENSVLETNQDMTDRLQVSNFRCTRSHSDCNGAINSIFTESRQVTVSKQLQIPVKSTKRYMTAHEIIIGEESSISHKKCDETSVNGLSEKGVSLAQEVGNGGPKSLVQQRIESLYGQHELKSYSYRVSRRGDHHHLNGKTESVPVSKRSPSCPPSTRGKTGNSLPVFRHLTKDFRKQLQGDISEPSDVLDSECSSDSIPKPEEPIENVLTKKEEASFIVAESESENMNVHEQECNNGFERLPNGHDIDESDRAVSVPLPQPKPTFNNLVKPSSLTDIVNAPVCDKEGYRFLDIMDVERREIESEIKKAEDDLENSDVPEDACGKIRAACGKANLLLSQKFEQFKELCLKNINENHTDQFYTTASDLAGFWDMVMLQVSDVKKTFQDIQALKENNWKEVSSAQVSPLNPKPKKHSSQNISKSNPCTPKRSAKSAELARAREEARKQLLAAKKRGRQQNTNQDENDIAIFVPSSSS